MIDALIVGSGPAGVNAACPLVQRGLRVSMLDYGQQDGGAAERIPPRSWTELRRTDPLQHSYFLGDRFEGIPLGPLRAGAQLTPPRQYLTAESEARAPILSTTFSGTQSLARGGFGGGWGAGVFPFDESDLADAPIGARELHPHYETVADRIGVSGDRDDLLPFLGDCDSMMPSLDIDSAGDGLLARYRKKRSRLNRRGFFLGKTRLAACSERHRERGPHPHLDLDFWKDVDRAVWRPAWTLDELMRHGNFQYLDRQHVLSFHEDEQGVEVQSLGVETQRVQPHRARSLVLAAGTLGSTRLVLRSLDRYDRPVPILCNPYTYVPVVNSTMIGREAKDRRHSLAQLTAFQRCGEQGSRLVQAQYYSYRSLLLFRLLKESPLSHRDSLRLLRRWQSILGIIGVHHEDRPTANKHCVLRRGPSEIQDQLEIKYEPQPEEIHRQRADERAILAAFRRIGCYPLRRIRPGDGASIHYAGSLPMSSSGEELSCDPDCRLQGTRSVYVTDGSVFPSLPAKGLTFTLMANANRVGEGLAGALLK